LDDSRILHLAAEREVGLILMHRLHSPGVDRYSDRYTQPPDYTQQGGVVEAVFAFLKARVDAAASVGIDPAALVLDPGLGFGKSVEQNLELLRATPRLATLGFPILSALSRKSFTARAAGLDPALPPKTRVHATIGLSVAHLRAGARLFRVHDVAPHRDALAAAWAATPTSAQSDTYRTC
jgi:dihydropteroate synthase